MSCGLIRPISPRQSVCGGRCLQVGHGLKSACSTAVYMCIHGISLLGLHHSVGSQGYSLSLLGRRSADRAVSSLLVNKWMLWSKLKCHVQGFLDNSSTSTSFCKNLYELVHTVQTCHAYFVLTASFLWLPHGGSPPLLMGKAIKARPSHSKAGICHLLQYPEKGMSEVSMVAFCQFYGSIFSLQSSICILYNVLYWFLEDSFDLCQTLNGTERLKVKIFKQDSTTQQKAHPHNIILPPFF